jgi:ArsR family transcriptional regulator
LRSFIPYGAKEGDDMIPIEKRTDLLKIIAHPIRIKILNELTQGVKCVSDFEDSLDISQPNISQHLSILRANGIVDFFVDGRNATSSKNRSSRSAELLKQEYEEDIPAPACCPVTKKGTYPGERRR